MSGERTDETEELDEGEPGLPSEPDVVQLEGPVPPAAGEQLVVIDGQVRADLPPAPPGVQWSTYGLDAAPPPPKRGLFAALAVVMLAVTGWTILGTGVITPNATASLLLAGWSTISVLGLGSIALRARWFSILVTAVMAVALPLTALAWVLALASAPGALWHSGLWLLATQVALTAPVIGGLIVAMRPRRPMRPLRMVSLVLAAAIVLAGAVFGAGPIVFGGHLSFGSVSGGLVVMLALPAAAVLVGFRHRTFRFSAAAVAAVALPIAALPGPGGWDGLQLLLLLPASGAVWCAFEAARRTVDEPSYGEQSSIAVAASDAAP